MNKKKTLKATQMSTPSLSTTSSVSTESECAPSDTNIGWGVQFHVFARSFLVKCFQNVGAPDTELVLSPAVSA